ncbi:MAG: hypothetical protein V2I67_20660 [Thermoanaerobaculales bacterium]|nr:hypothetical protein [Thermoanaerobaculales bacterium]
MGFFDTAGFAIEVAVYGGHVFVADSDAGFEVFQECQMFSDGFESGDTSAWL